LIYVFEKNQRKNVLKCFEAFTSKPYQSKAPRNNRFLKKIKNFQKKNFTKKVSKQTASKFTNLKFSRDRYLQEKKFNISFRKVTNVLLIKLFLELLERKVRAGIFFCIVFHLETLLTIF
jgi:hypothetical protein